jgi:thioredoxin 1
MIILTENIFDSELKGKYCLVNFGNETCYPCALMKQNLTKLESRIRAGAKIQFGYVDIDNCPLLEDKYDIENYPTLILFRDGVEVGRREGNKRPEEIVKFIAECLQL